MFPRYGRSELEELGPGILRRDWEKERDRLPEEGVVRYRMLQERRMAKKAKPKPAKEPSEVREEPPKPIPSRSSWELRQMEKSDTIDKAVEVARRQGRKNLGEYEQKLHRKPILTGDYAAMECLYRAEKSIAFKKAMLAAEAAATSAPSGKQEELASAAGAQLLKAANVTSMEKMKRTLVDGDKLIEVVGYIGITKPKENQQAE